MPVIMSMIPRIIITRSPTSPSPTRPPTWSPPNVPSPSAAPTHSPIPTPWVIENGAMPRTTPSPSETPIYAIPIVYIITRRKDIHRSIEPVKFLRVYTVVCFDEYSRLLRGFFIIPVVSFAFYLSCLCLQAVCFCLKASDFGLLTLPLRNCNTVVGAIQVAAARIIGGRRHPASREGGGHRKTKNQPFHAQIY